MQGYLNWNLSKVISEVSNMIKEIPIKEGEERRNCQGVYCKNCIFSGSVPEEVHAILKDMKPVAGTQSINRCAHVSL